MQNIFKTKKIQPQIITAVLGVRGYTRDKVRSPPHCENRKVKRSETLRDKLSGNRPHQTGTNKLKQFIKKANIKAHRASYTRIASGIEAEILFRGTRKRLQRKARPDAQKSTNITRYISAN